MPDPRQEFTSRIGFISFSVLVLAFILISRLFQVQIVDHSENVEELEDKLTTMQYFISGRGTILSQDGAILAHDAPSYQLQCRLIDVTFGEGFGLVEEIRYYLYPRSKRYMALREAGLQPPEQGDLLKKIGNCSVRLKRDALVLDMAQQLNLETDELVSALQNSFENVVKKWATLNSEQTFDIYLSNKAAQRLINQPDRFAGFSCRESSVRKYPQNDLACHTVGYLGRLNEKNYNIIRVKGYYPPEENVLRPLILTELEKRNLSWVRNYNVGISGVEWIFNNELRGQLQNVTFRRDLDRYEQDLPKITEGQDLVLTIDSRLQRLAQDLLNNRKGSIVLLDLDSGDILTAASYPSYNPNLITPPTEVNFDDYIQSNPGMLINRCIGNHYPFGSIYKIITATAVLEEAIATPESTFFCAHVHPKTKLKCLGNHGDICVNKALEKSCNIYFYDSAIALGPIKLYNWAQRFGLGKPLGVGFPYEKGGVNPNPLYKQEQLRQAWFPGDTCHMAIGQGFQLGTPLQAAVIAGIISREKGCGHPQFWKRAKVSAPMAIDIQPQNRQAILAGLWAVINEPKGTGYSAHSNKIVFAGKTGTADVHKQIPHAWFCGFAPFDEPRVAISVLLENAGHGGTESAPLAKAMFEKWKELYLDVQEASDHSPDNFALPQ